MHVSKGFIQLGLLVLLIGCDVDTDKHVDSVKHGVDRTLEGAQQGLDFLTPKAKQLKEDAGSEVEKLFEFEYKVVELDGTANADRIQDRLALLGKDRWDCFHVERTDEKLLIMCKRRPKTNLQYLEHIF